VEKYILTDTFTPSSSNMSILVFQLQLVYCNDPLIGAVSYIPLQA